MPGYEVGISSGTIGLYRKLGVRNRPIRSLDTKSITLFKPHVSIIDPPPAILVKISFFPDPKRAERPAQSGKPAHSSDLRLDLTN